MSDSIQKQIMDLREISDSVNDFILQQQFLSTTEEQAIDPTEVMLQCRSILLEELKEFGIIPSNTEELILDGYKLRNAINIREVFDAEFLKMFITGLNDNDAEDFKNLLKDKYTVDKEFGLENLTGFILDRYPNNKKFQMMKYYASDFFVDNTFYSRLFNIFESTVRFISESNEDNLMIADYLKHKFKHIDNVKKAANYLMSLKYDRPFSSVELRARLSIHDRDLISSEKVREVSLLWKLKQKENVNHEAVRQYEEIEETHHKSNRHHLEYFASGTPIELVDKIEIVSDIYNEQPTKEQYINDVIKTFEGIDIAEEVKKNLIGFANRLDLWGK